MGKIYAIREKDKKMLPLTSIEWEFVRELGAPIYSMGNPHPLTYGERRTTLHGTLYLGEIAFRELEMTPFTIYMELKKSNVEAVIKNAMILQCRLVQGNRAIAKIVAGDVEYVDILKDGKMTNARIASRLLEEEY